MISQALATYCTSTCEQQNDKNRWSFWRKDMQFTCSSHLRCQYQRAADRSWVTRSWRRRPPYPPPPPAWQCPCSRLASLETPWQGTPLRKLQCSGKGSIDISWLQSPHLGLVVSLGELQLILPKVEDGMVWTRHPASTWRLCNQLFFWWCIKFVFVTLKKGIATCENMYVKALHSLG